jgi:hypothetical protein
MASFTIPWNTVNSLVGDKVMPTVRRQVYQSDAFLNRLARNKQGYDGGRTIQQPLVWRTEIGEWFSGADVLDTSITDTVQMAVFRPKNFAAKMVVTWDDERAVRGPKMVKSLVSLKMQEVRRSAMHHLAADLFNDGSDAKRLTGLQYILRDFTGTAPGTLPSQTYGGITRAGRYDGSGGGTQTNNWWVHQGDNTAYTDAAGGAGGFDPYTAGQVSNVLGRMWANILLAAGTAQPPTLMLSNVGCWTAYMNSLMLGDRRMYPQQDTELAKAGYDNVKFHRATWIMDEKAPRSSAKVEKLYFINEESVILVVDNEADFAFSPFVKPHNQLARIGWSLWRGELMCIEPRANGVISNITVSTVS